MAISIAINTFIIWSVTDQIMPLVKLDLGESFSIQYRMLLAYLFVSLATNSKIDEGKKLVKHPYGSKL